MKLFDDNDIYIAACIFAIFVAVVFFGSFMVGRITKQCPYQASGYDVMGGVNFIK